MSPGSIDTVIGDLSDSIGRLDLTGYQDLIPDDGFQMAYALPDARSKDDVAIFSGSRIILSADYQVTRMVLTAIRFDATVRCVAVIRYSPEIIGICDGMMMEICSFDRTREPPGITSIDWGVAFCSERADGVPDLIYDLGCQGKEPLIRILGESPTRVTANLNRIITRIKNTNHRGITNGS